MLALIFFISAVLIIYTYFGYPLLVALVARIHPRPVRRDDAYTPPLTLLIAAYNEQDVIADKLENSLALDYPTDRLQILVATDGSDDRTPDLVKQYAERGIELNHRPERRGKMAAIDRALPLVHGEIIVLSDANAFYHPDTLRKLVRNFADDQVGAASGKKTMIKEERALAQSENLYWRYESFLKKQESLVDSTTGVVGEMLALRRALYQPPSQAVVNDDFYLAYAVLKQGYRVIYEPEAIAEERMSKSLQDERIRRSRIVAGRFQLFSRPDTIPWRRPWIAFAALSHKGLRPLVPLLMLLSYVANLLWWLTAGGKATIPAVFLAGQTLFYLSAVAGWLLDRQGIRLKLLYIPYYFCSANLSAWGGLVKFVTGGQSTQWKKVR
jgi:cellulose synthase/poly-beta-1,6-N-acetylglucosamine synthase-like glycosyltransferase